MSSSEFTPDKWAKVARIPLATASLFTRDLVDMQLAELVAGNRYRLTRRGRIILRALREVPSLEDAA